LQAVVHPVAVGGHLLGQGHQGKTVEVAALP